MDPLCHLVKRGDIFFRIMFSKIILYTKETQYVTVIKTLKIIKAQEYRRAFRGGSSSCEF